MRLRTGLLYLAAGLVGLVSLPRLVYGDAADTAAHPDSKNAEPAAFGQQVAPLLSQYCTRCHSGSRPKGGLAFDTFKDEAEVVLKGRLAPDGGFQVEPNGVMAKCPSKYEAQAQSASAGS